MLLQNKSTAHHWTLSDEVTERERINGALAAEAAAEGTVLLENDGTLPLKKGTAAALWGCGAVFTVKGGTGSGEVNNRITDETMYFHGLNSVYKLTNSTYLNGCLDAFEQVKNGTVQDDNPHVTPMTGFFGKYYIGAETAITDAELHETSPDDAALFVISRISGEGYDREAKQGDGDYFLSPTERANLEKAAAYYDKIIIILNMAAVMDTAFIREINAKKHGVIAAVVLAGQGGEFAGTALAKVLCGDASPSGKLTDTWPVSFKDLPSSATLDQNYDAAYPDKRYDEYYYDDIYVGYRYFDTFNVTPAYEFGFGMAYTDFNIEVLSASADEKSVEAEVCVTNIGKACGKEVIQLYVSAPDGSLEKPYQTLAAFAKTGLLAPGQGQTLRVSFPTAAMASYSEEQAAYILEKGSYILRVGNSSRNTSVAAVISLEKTVITEQLSNRIAPTPEKAKLLENKKVHKTADTRMYTYAAERAQMAAAPHIKLNADAFATANNASAVQNEQVVSFVSANDADADSAKYAARGGWKARKASPYGAWAAAIGLGGFNEETSKAPETIKKVETVKNATLLDVYKGRITMEQFVAGLSVEELSYIVNGVDADAEYGTGFARRGECADMFAWDGTPLGSAVGFLANYTPGTVWASSGRFYNSRLIPSINLPDGPAGPRLTRTGKQKLYRVASPRIINDDKTVKEPVIDSSEQIYYQFATSWPVGCMLAQTWNEPLMRQVGRAYGEELAEFGCTLLLGPGMNIHRTPLCGRNFEYFSEDPAVTGIIASALILGTQSNDGVGLTIKHFAGNNNENGRMFANDVVSERALREIYLKGFEIAIKAAQPMALMTSYNLINEQYTVNNYALLSDICKNEWGFAGCIMSDYNAANQAQNNNELCLNPWANILHAGNDWIMGGSADSVRPGTDEYGSSYDQSFQHLILGGSKPAMALGDIQKCAATILKTIMYSNKFGDDMVSLADSALTTPQQLAELAAIHNGPYTARVANILQPYVNVVCDGLCKP